MRCWIYSDIGEEGFLLFFLFENGRFNLISSHSDHIEYSLFAEWYLLTTGRGVSEADPLENSVRICLKNDARVTDFVDYERHRVHVLDEVFLLDITSKHEAHRVVETVEQIDEHDLVGVVSRADDVEEEVYATSVYYGQLIQHDYLAVRFGRLAKQLLLECTLLFDCGEMIVIVLGLDSIAISV